MQKVRKIHYLLCFFLLLPVLMLTAAFTPGAVRLQPAQAASLPEWAGAPPPTDEPEMTTGRGSQGGRDEEEERIPISITDRLAAPPMPARPSQADYGAQVYYQVCMACHGDKGQGLTEEWRVIWEEDSYCWGSKCHGPSHPPWGFEFPKITSPVIGPGTLTKYKTALELHQYTIDTMPWWNPGYLQEEEFWQVTAFLMRENGFMPDEVTLSAGNAAVFRLYPEQPLPGDTRPQILFVAATLAAAAGLLMVQDRLRR